MQFLPMHTTGDALSWAPCHSSLLSDSNMSPRFIQCGPQQVTYTSVRERWIPFASFMGTSRAAGLPHGRWLPVRNHPKEEKSHCWRIRVCTFRFKHRTNRTFLWKLGRQAHFQSWLRPSTGGWRAWYFSNWCVVWLETLYRYGSLVVLRKVPNAQLVMLCNACIICIKVFLIHPTAGII